ncbi:hypothetical protein SHELI_v1c04580 [Spiroplasma helicoides]|uniref:Uncharacterized protein n=1 Tax=Spiroplasma helicoides TaxID=216938 RepID=A0A1B3SKF7_9MOLU|nr:hypothetical protein [Spiroplasma helicoides]AOG60409.1 hypothetical protein SHELI_v1c04580 [Spiroplasma helicoides]
MFKIINSSGKIKNFEDINKLVIISCVDNHKTILFIEESIKHMYSICKLSDYYNIKNFEKYVLHIDSANEDLYGDIIVNYFRSNLYVIKPENEKQLVISEEHCQELINDGVIQQFSANDQASNIILKILSNINKWEYKSSHIKFDNLNSKIDFIKKDYDWT